MTGGRTPECSTLRCVSGRPSYRPSSRFSSFSPTLSSCFRVGRGRISSGTSSRNSAKRSGSSASARSTNSSNLALLTRYAKLSFSFSIFDFRFSIGHFMRHRIVLTLIVLLSGCGMPSFLITPVRNTNVLQEVDAQPGKGFKQGKIALIEVEGMLMNVKSGGFLQPTENPLSLFVQQLEQAEKDGAVKAVVLRVNSPGGTVTTSDAMYQLLIRFRRRTHKPVVASCQEVCASGAYYVSCAADRIVAQPTSVVGSIGVIFNTFDLSGTMAKI